MRGQLSLFGNARARRVVRAPGGRDVVFFALMLGPALAGRVAPLMAWLRAAFGVTAPALPIERLHVSVMGAGFRDDMSDEDVAAVRAAAEAVDFVPFELGFADVATFGRGEGNRLPLVLLPDAGAGLVRDLAERLSWAMIEQGYDPRGRPVLEAPHLTLCYDAVRVPRTTLSAPLRVRVGGVSLIHSHRGEGRYSVLWPAAADA